MPGEQELEFSPDMDGTPVEIDDEDEPEPIRALSLEETRAGFMLLDL